MAQRDRWTTRAVALLVALVAGAFVLSILRSGGAAATVRQSGAPPIAQCSWSLVDADANIDTGVAYGPDADPGAVAGSEGAPCAYEPGSGAVTQAAGTLRMLEVRPNPGADASPVAITGFVTASQPVGGGPVETVTMRVQRPDGVTQALVEAVRSDCGDTSPAASFRWAMIADGGTGALAGASVTNSDGRGLFDRCRQSDVQLFEARWQVTAADPCGAYGVEFTVGNDSGETRLHHVVDVVCFHWLEIDFSSLAWQVAPGAESTIVGDEDPGTPELPTVSNAGNMPLAFGMEMMPLVPAGGGAPLDGFTAGLGDPGGWVALSAGDVTWFDGAGDVVCAGSDAPLGLTLRTPIDAARDSYSGSLTVWARPADPTACVPVAAGKSS